MKAKITTKIAMTTVVTIAEVAIAIVEMTSPSSEFALTFAFYIALRAHGIFRFVMFPVINDRYVPPAPKSGV